MWAYMFANEPAAEDSEAEPGFPRAPGKCLRTARLPARVHRKATAGAAIEPVAGPLLDRAAGEPGAPLPRDLRAELQQALGVDLDAVRVHTGPAAAQAAEAIGARAFAVGQDVHFGAGAYDPDTAAGRHLIAHEVAHTVQERGAPATGAATAVSEPGDAHEREADAFADAFTAGTAARTTPPATPPVRAGTASRAMIRKSGAVAPTEPVDLPYSPIEVVPGDSVSERWSLRESFRPLDVPIIVGEVPLRAGVDLGVTLDASASAGYGPGMIDDVSMHFAAEEAAAARAAYALAGAWGLFPLLCLRDHDGQGTFELPVAASAQFQARGEAAPFVGDPTASLTLAAIGGLEGRAAVEGRAEPSVHVDFTLHPFDRPTLAETRLAYHVEAATVFTLDVYAGVRVSFQLDVPLLEELLAPPSFWPSWLPWPLAIIPTPKHPWSKELVQRWNAYEYREDFTMDGEVWGGATAGTPSGGVRIDRKSDGGLASALSALAASKPDVPMPRHDDGPSGEGAADADAVRIARAAAHVALTRAGAAIAHAGRPRTQPAPAPRGPSTQAEPTDPADPAPPSIQPVAPQPAPGTDPGERQAELEHGLQSLTAKVKGLDAYGTAADPGTLGAVKGGYDAATAGADELTASARDGGDDGEVDRDEAARDRCRKAASAARLDLLEVKEPLAEEHTWVDEQAAALGGNQQLGDYRAAITSRKATIDRLWARYQKYARKLEWAELNYADGPWEEGAECFEQLSVDLEVLADELQAVPARPVQPWDTDYVELVGGELRLIARYRQHKYIRLDFYPTGYQNATLSWRDRQVGALMPLGDKVYWHWDGKPSPRGDFWWDYEAEYTEAPSIDHRGETTVAHWNRAGRFGLYPERVHYYNGDGDFDANLDVVPRMHNNSLGAGDKEDSGGYQELVGVEFRGSKR